MFTFSKRFANFEVFQFPARPNENLNCKDVNFRNCNFTALCPRRKLAFLVQNIKFRTVPKLLNCTLKKKKRKEYFSKGKLKNLGVQVQISLAIHSLRCLCLSGPCVLVLFIALDSICRAIRRHFPLSWVLIWSLHCLRSHFCVFLMTQLRITKRISVAERRLLSALTITLR